MASSEEGDGDEEEEDSSGENLSLKMLIWQDALRLLLDFKFRLEFIF
jgi:hypothetical protein